MLMSYYSINVHVPRCASAHGIGGTCGVDGIISGHSPTHPLHHCAPFEMQSRYSILPPIIIHYYVAVKPPKRFRISPLHSHSLWQAITVADLLKSCPILSTLGSVQYARIPPPINPFTDNNNNDDETIN